MKTPLQQAEEIKKEVLVLRDKLNNIEKKTKKGRNAIKVLLIIYLQKAKTLLEICRWLEENTCLPAHIEEINKAIAICEEILK